MPDVFKVGTTFESYFPVTISRAACICMVTRDKMLMLNKVVGVHGVSLSVCCILASAVEKIDRVVHLFGRTVKICDFAE